MKIPLNALEARVVEVLRRRYPITTDELGEELSVRRDTLERTLKGLAVKGVLALEPLPDKTYIRLLVGGTEPDGRSPTEREDDDRECDSFAYR